MQEALAIGDFIFDDTLNKWLSDVDCEASCWLNIKDIINMAQKELSGLELSQVIEREEPYLTISQDKLQNFHCELLGKFREQLKM
ncbi:hypothetical protein [Photobacterium kishitanii]|nr:hypothetical protein [Photobacterium kishitanii]